MKTIESYIIASFLGLGSLFLLPENIENSVPVEITWGRGYYCQLRGICDIKPDTLSTPFSDQIIIDGNGNPLYIEIQKNSLTEEERMYHLSDNFIEIDKGFSLGINRNIDGKENEIKSGIYPIQNGELSYRIVISNNGEPKD